MIRLSRLADYGLVLMGRMAVEPSTVHTAVGLAEDTQLPMPTVAKLLVRLTQGGLLISHRGAKGGYELARGASAITVADIVVAVDGPIALTQCLEHGPGNCEVEPICPTRHGWNRLNDAVKRALTEVSLAELARPLPYLQPSEDAGIGANVADA
ncbi:MAG TPA: SUF system Fe-S cluster assembly regulator [Alphaproteobacteria bacterium]|nr:SUF system Fe-S cluster assembly regulator [Alphaproteobacteria bacterium]